MRNKIWIIMVSILIVALGCTLTAMAEEEVTGTIGYLTYSIANGEVWITDCETTASGVVEIPDVIEGYPVTRIGDAAFKNCSAITNVGLPDTVTHIGFQAFAFCSNLEEINLPSELKTTNNYVFYFCNKLTSLTLPAKLQTISPYQLYGMYNVEEIWVDESNPYMSNDENGVVYNKDKTGLLMYPWGKTGSYVVPDGVESLENLAFAFTKISEISLPDSLTVIGEKAFWSCEQLNKVVIPSGVVRICTDAFYGNLAMTEVTFKHTVDDTLAIWAEAFGRGVASPLTIYVSDVDNIHTKISGYDWEGNNYVITYAEIPGQGTNSSEQQLGITVNNTGSSVSGAVLTAPENGWTEGTNTFTISCEKACVVAVSYDGGATYTRLTATAADEGYSFTAENMTAETIIGVAVVGDANGDGNITNADITRLRAAYAGKIALDGLQRLAVDTNGSGDVTNADITKLRAAFAGKTQLDW